MQSKKEKGKKMPVPETGESLKVLRRPDVNGMNYEITYKGKTPEEEAIKGIPSASLEVLHSFGEPKDWANILVFGDNLPVLKHLLDTEVAGRLRLVYIDPPYSTRQTFTTKHNQHAYHDGLSGARYLEFLRVRLILLRELLAADGSIYVHLDDNMAYPVKVLMDEVFGPRNFRNWITRQKCNPKNYTRNQYGNIQDFILFYTKGNKWTWNRPYEERGLVYDLEQRFPRIEEGTGRRYALVPLHARGVRRGETGKPWRNMLPPPGKHWQYIPSMLEEMDRRGKIYWSPTGNPRRKIYADESPGVSVQDIWLNFKDERNQMVECTGYPTEKNPDLLRKLIFTSSNPGDLILDCFCGAGTTLITAEELGRRWIGVDSSKTAIDISSRRIQATRKKLTQPSRAMQGTLFEDAEPQCYPWLLTQARTEEGQQGVAQKRRRKAHIPIIQQSSRVLHAR